MLNFGTTGFARLRDFLQRVHPIILCIMTRVYSCIALPNNLPPKSLIYLYAVQMTKNAYIGALVDGIVTDIHTYGLHLRIKNTDLR